MADNSDAYLNRMPSSDERENRIGELERELSQAKADLAKARMDEAHEHAIGVNCAFSLMGILADAKKALTEAQISCATNARNKDVFRLRAEKLSGLLHRARVRVRFMNGRVLSLEQAIRSNAKLSGAAYIRASKSEDRQINKLAEISIWTILGLLGIRAPRNNISCGPECGGERMPKALTPEPAKEDGNNG